MTLFSRVTEICRERLPSIRVARITIDSIFDLDKMLQPGIRFGVTVRNTSGLVGTPIASMTNFYFTVDVMDGDEKWIIQRMSHWLNGTYEEFYRIFNDEVCVTRLDGVEGEELGWRNAYDVFQLNTQIKSEWEKKAGVYNLTKNVPPTDDFYTLSVMSTEAQYAPTHVPDGVRKVGLIITFRSHSEWETWQFSGAGDFIAAGNWKRIDPFIEQGVYDMDQQSPLLSGQYYQCSNDDDAHYIPSSIPVESRVAFMKVRYINSYGKRVILRYALADFAYFNNYDYWDVLKVSDLSSADIEKMLTGDISSHTHEHLRDVFRLLYLGADPPMEDVVTGEQYYDTVEDKIHTAINTEVDGEFLVWDIFGAPAKDNALYVSESDATYNTNRVWLYKEGYMRSLGVVQPQMDNAIFLSKNDEVMVSYNTSEEKADIIIGDRVKNRFVVIVPETTNGMIYINMIFNNVVPFGFLAEYEVYLYIESIHITNTVLSVTSTVEPLETYTAGRILGTLESTDIVGKGLHKLTYIRDRATASTHMSLYVKHEYFEKL